MFIDTHCHLTLEPLAMDPQAVIDRARLQGVERLVTIGIDDPQQQAVLSLLDQTEHVYAALGYHPTEASALAVGAQRAVPLRDLTHRLAHPKVIALGEIGLDYYHGADSKAAQQQLFRAQIELAQSLSLPIVIHTREAFDDTLSILGEYDLPRVLIHSFTGDTEQAQRVLEGGYLIGLNGILTFNSAKPLQAAVRELIPLERMVLETDAPFLAPQPVRGQTNESQYIPMVAEQVAQLKGVELATVEAVTTANALSFFDRLPNLA